jgi:multidrug resistance efflux pump
LFALNLTKLAGVLAGLAGGGQAPLDTAFDNAKEGLRNAEASLEAAKAQLGTAKDALSYTELRAGASGVITARSLEAGQVVHSPRRAGSVYGLHGVGPHG